MISKPLNKFNTPPPMFSYFLQIDENDEDRQIEQIEHLFPYFQLLIDAKALQPHKISLQIYINKAFPLVVNVNFSELKDFFMRVKDTAKHPQELQSVLLREGNHFSVSESNDAFMNFYYTFLTEVENSLEYLRMVRVSDEIQPKINTFCQEWEMELNKISKGLRAAGKKFFSKIPLRNSASRTKFLGKSSFKKKLSDLLEISQQDLESNYSELLPKIEALIGVHYKDNPDLVNTNLASLIEAVYNRVSVTRAKHYPKDSIKYADALHNTCLIFEISNNFERGVEYSKRVLQVYEQHDDYYIYPEVFTLAETVLQDVSLDIFQRNRLEAMKARVLKEVKESPDFQTMRDLFEPDLEDNLRQKIFHTLYRIGKYVETGRIVYDYFNLE